MSRCLQVFVAIFTGVRPVAGEIKIDSFARSGEMTWSGTRASDSICLQWSPTPAGPWYYTLNGQALVFGGATNQTTIPLSDELRFFRIRRAELTSVVEALTESQTINQSHLSVRFDLPPGDGRGAGNGVVVFPDDAFEAFGSTWEFNYSGNDPVSGIQVIHPHRNGQCIIVVHLNSLGLHAPERWADIGYLDENTATLIRTPDFATVFPLQRATAYHIKTAVTPAGAVSITVNGVLVATGTVPTVYPIDFILGFLEKFQGRSSSDFRQFRGAGFPFLWKAGHAGLIVEPTDPRSGGFNGVFNVKYSPGL